MHCGDCSESELPSPMPIALAARFGWAHSKAITQQSLCGLHRTAAMWAIPATGVVVLLGGERGLRRLPGTTKQPVTIALHIAATSMLMQTLWTSGYAVVSGVRTAVRLSHLTSANVIPVMIVCPHGGPRVYANVHHHPLGTSWYVDGVFAWPRHRGGGPGIMRRLLARADAEQATLTLTAMSPRVAAAYRKVGFRQVFWIYYMRREPLAPP